MNHSGDEVNRDAAKPPAATAPSNAGGGIGGGGGISFLSKRRAAGTAAHNTAPPTTAPADTLAPIATIAAINPPIQQPINTNVPTNIIDGMETSVANLSQFDTDLMSKNTEAAVGNNAAVGVPNFTAETEQGVVNNAVDGEDEEEVPKTIRTSGDDVDDDLTEATAITFAMATEVDDGVMEAPRDEQTYEQQEPSTTMPKASPYFTNPTNVNVNIATAQMNTEETADVMAGAKTLPPTSEHVAMDTNNGSPLREDIVIPGITAHTVVQQQPTAKIGAGVGTNATITGAAGVDEDVAKAAEPMPKPAPKPTNAGGSTLSPKQAPTQRVSLSPCPGIGTKKGPSYSPMMATTNKAATLSPKGPVITSLSPKNTGNTFGTEPSLGVGARTTLSPRQVPTQRVSLSPVPGAGKAGATLSPKAGQFAATSNDQTIVIPGVARPVTNNNPAAESKINHVGANQTGRVLPTKSNPVGYSSANRFAKPGQTNVGSLKMNAMTRTKPSSLLLRSNAIDAKTNAQPAVNNLSMQRPNALATNSSVMGKINNSTSNTENTAVTFAVPKTRPTATAPVEIRKPAPNSTSISPAQAKTAGTTPANKNAVVTPYYHQKGSAGMEYDDSSDDTTLIVPGMPTANTGPKAMEVQPQAEEPAQRRSHSNTVYSPQPMNSPESTVTPKASNVAHNANVNTAPATSFNTSHQTDDTFDDLLQQFVSDIQAGNDIYERGVNDLLELDVDCTHAFNACLHYKDQYLNLLGEIENIQATAEEILADVGDY